MAFSGKPYGTGGGVDTPTLQQDTPIIRVADTGSFIAFLWVNGPITVRQRSQIEDIVRILEPRRGHYLALLIREDGLLVDADIDEINVLDGIVVEAVSPGVVQIRIPNEGITDEMLGAAIVNATHLADSSVTLSKLAPNSVDASKIVDGSIGTAELANAAVTLDKLAANSVDASKIVDGSIGAAELANLSVTLAKLAANSVDASKIVDGSVGAAELATDAVTAAKIATGAVGSDELATDAVTNAKIATGAVGNDELAAGAVTITKLASNSVDASKIIDGTVGASEIATDAVNAGHIAAGAVGSSELATDAVIAAKLATDSVTADAIAQNAVGPAELAPLAVGNGHIQDNAITAEKIAANAVDTSEIAGYSIFNSHLNDEIIQSRNIVDGAVGPTKLSETYLKVQSLPVVDVELVGSAETNHTAGGINKNQHTITIPAGQNSRVLFLAFIRGFGGLGTTAVGSVRARMTLEGSAASTGDAVPMEADQGVDSLFVCGHTIGFGQGATDRTLTFAWDWIRTGGTFTTRSVLYAYIYVPNVG